MALELLVRQELIMAEKSKPTKVLLLDETSNIAGFPIDMLRHCHMISKFRQSDTISSRVWRRFNF
jgi:hypothetical protein